MRRFFYAVRALGYGGNLKHLWSELDDDASGFISLKELDAKARSIGAPGALWKRRCA